MKYIVKPTSKESWFCHCTDCNDCTAHCSSECSDKCNHSACTSGYTVTI